jgi:hypothetical protein
VVVVVVVVGPAVVVVVVVVGPAVVVVVVVGTPVVVVVVIKGHPLGLAQSKYPKSPQPCPNVALCKKQNDSSLGSRAQHNSTICTVVVVVVVEGPVVVVVVVGGGSIAQPTKHVLYSIGSNITSIPVPPGFNAVI